MRVSVALAFAVAIGRGSSASGGWRLAAMNAITSAGIVSGSAWSVLHTVQVWVTAWVRAWRT